MVRKVTRTELMTAAFVIALPNMLLGSWVAGGQGLEKAAIWGALAVTLTTIFVMLGLWLYSSQKDLKGDREFKATWIFVFVLTLALLSWYGGALLSHFFGTGTATALSFAGAIIFMWTGLGLYYALDKVADGDVTTTTGKQPVKPNV